MSSNPFRTPGNDAFAGGARINASPPTNVSGTLAPPGGGPTQPVGGVQPAGINFARNNRGSNITIPHARVVPVSPVSSALPSIHSSKTMTSKTHDGIGSFNRPFGGLLESDGVVSGAVGFVLGRRSDQRTIQDNTLNVPGVADRHFDTSNQWSIAHTRFGAGVDRVDRMCGLEYLNRYLSITMRAAKVNLSTTVVNPATFDNSGVLGFAKPMIPAAGTVAKLADFLEANQPTNLITHQTPAGAVPSATAATNSTHMMGVHATDVSPFIHGKSFATGLVDLNANKSMGHMSDGNSRRIYTSRSLPDQVCITVLEKELQKMGLFDWRPDGVVLSKENSGQTDPTADQEFDLRLQQLFNIAVQGPATLTELVNNRMLVSMPGDLVFVVVLCDRMQLTDNAGDKETYTIADATKPDGVDKSKELTSKEVWDRGLNKGADSYDIENYEIWKKTQFAAGDKRTAADIWTAVETDRTANAPGKDVALGNFRLRMSTSAEMINYSGVNVQTEDDGAGTVTKRWAPKGTERMGLGWGPSVAEYILGGWCIGRILDSASSRAAVPGMFSSQDPTTFAVSLDVHVEWWTGDKMFRHFYNREGVFSARGEAPSGAPTQNVNKPNGL